MGQSVPYAADVIGVQELSDSGRTLAPSFGALANQVGEYTFAHVDERDVQPENKRAMDGHLNFERKRKIDRFIQRRYRKAFFPGIEAGG